MNSLTPNDSGVWEIIEGGLAPMSSGSLPKVQVQLSGFEKVVKLLKDVGFPVAIAIFLLCDRLTVMRQFEQTMIEVKLMLKEVRDKLDVIERGR
jgi:hypothetical protein